METPSTRSYPIGQHPDMPPPSSEVGLWHWLHSRFFSGPVNIILTLLSAWLVLSIVPPVLDWALISAKWVGAGPQDCPPASDGACWFFITDRMKVFLSGFYPPAELWRPAFAFVLLVAAVIPILMENVPMRRAWLMGALAYPFIALALLRGGAVPLPPLPFAGGGLFSLIFWGALALALGVGIRRLARARSGRVGPWAVYLCFLPIIGALILLSGSGLPLVLTADWGGFLLTLVVGVTGIAASLPLGVLLALGRQSDLPAIRTICVFFIEVFRGVPLITLLFMASVMLPLFAPEGVSFDKLLRALVVVALFASAYMAEVVRGGLQAIPRGQIEAASALGLSYWQTTGLIVLPQALRIVIPGIVNTFIGLFKDTTLVSIIGLLDLLGIANSALQDPHWIGRPGGLFMEAYVFVALVFWIFCYGMSQYSQRLEARLNTGGKGGQG